tara:strand:+ start:75 stop:341 length:267 start_codon:yes stop_codon:yes gene_type:complete
MKIELLDKQYEIKEISYKKRREIYQLNVKAFWDNKVDPDLYYEVLNKCFELSGLNENDIKDLSMVQVDQLLQKILTSYLGIEKKENGA